MAASDSTSTAIQTLAERTNSQSDLIRPHLNRFIRFARWLLAMLACLVFLGQSTAPDTPYDRVRPYTGAIEFDYGSWTLQALHLKTEQLALNLVEYLPDERQVSLVKDYLQLVNELNLIKVQIDLIYSDPAIASPDTVAADLLARQEQLQRQRDQMRPTTESILQQQVSSILAETGIAPGGQPIPPVVFHTTDLPLALIVSPRDSIRQDANISLLPDLSTEYVVDLETEIDSSLSVSSLVVPVGGVGIYPPMVMNTTDLPWLLETIAHEWTHNFLTLRPLGIRYDQNPEMRSINETVASLVGKEIGHAVIAQYYPEYLPKEPAPVSDQTVENSEASTETDTSTVVEERPVFDYRATMHDTRVVVDEMLADGRIEEAEQYMELRRELFWQNGYQIRKLNQAYFAFYGAYADTPGGAAGEDPVGPAVRALRANSPSLADFLNEISYITSFDELIKRISQFEY